ncbi:type VI secretion system tip protein VgrG, partial [Pseudomonas citronellolis]|nr:type VI secretion system tip protein VgrG [Pseudomonas citronellolis]
GFYKDDFSSTANDRDKALFMHEMTHVWQYQLGYRVKWHALWVTSRGASAYQYQLAASGTLSDYNMEQQGEIISDYFMICVLQKPKFVWDPTNSSKEPALLEIAVQNFLSDPNDTSSLPK